MNAAILDGNNRPTRFGFACGCIERLGEHVSIVREHGAYIVTRSPAHPRGWFREGRRTIGDARRLARALMRPPIIEIQINGDPYGRGFVGSESKDGGRSWFYRGDVGAQSLAWWRAYARRYGAILREAR